MAAYLGVKIRYADLVDHTPTEPEKSADEVIAGIKTKLSGGSQGSESV